MNQLAGWSNNWAQFFQTEKTSFLEKLTQFHDQLPWTKILDQSQLNAWDIEYNVVLNTLRYVCEQAQLSPELCWVAFEQELVGEGGKRAADVNLVLPTGDFFVIEFKHKTEASEHEILRANFDLQTMLRFHSESIELKGHCFLALTKPGAKVFKSEGVVCDIPSGGILPQLSQRLIESLKKDHYYDVSQWYIGTFYRQPSILHGTVQVFFDELIPTLKTAAGENIVMARQNLISLYEHARQNNKRYLVVVNGRPGAGKTLLGISVVADLVKQYGAEQCKPVFLSGNAPLVNVLQYTLDYYGSNKGKEQVIDGRSVIEDLVNFKRSIQQQSRHKARDENFVVFDEAQRAWEKVNPRDKSSMSELDLFCAWLAQKKYGVLVLLVGDGQAIHKNEMSLDKMLGSLDKALASYGDNITTIMPELHSHHCNHFTPKIRDVFNLKIPIRQAYTNDLDAWIEAILVNDISNASAIAARIQCAYPLILTKSKSVADDYARELQKTLHENNNKADAFRCGWLISSRGGDFIPEVDKNKKMSGSTLGKWYVEPPNSEFSCCQLNTACSEFSSQGLELSLALFNWGNDLLLRNGQFVFSSENAFRRQQNHYTEGSYRVLLSRGRNGLVIKCDDAETFEYLRSCGMHHLE